MLQVTLTSYTCTISRLVWTTLNKNDKLVNGLRGNEKMDIQSSAWNILIAEYRVQYYVSE